MTREEWIRLWIANNLMQRRSGLYPLLVGESGEGKGSWNFPERIALQASLHERRNAISELASEGLIQLIPSNWFPQADFDFPTDVTIDNPEEVEVALTQAGHDYWERLFQPDWDRYIEINSVQENPDGSVSVTLICTSNLMRRALKEHLAELMELDVEEGVTESSCVTILAFRATQWKVLPFAKEVTFIGRVDKTFSRILSEAKQNPDKVEEYRALVRERFDLIGVQQNRATRILRRLSAVWDVEVESGRGSSDSLPIRLTP